MTVSSPNKNNLWLALLALIVTLAGITATLSLTQKRQLSQKAARENLSISFASSNLSVKKGQLFKVPIHFNTGSQLIKGVDLQVNFSTGKDKICLLDIETIADQTTPLKIFIPVIENSGKFNKTKIIRQSNSTGVVKFGAVAAEWDQLEEKTINPFSTGEETVLATLTFRAEESGRIPLSFCLWENNDSCGTNQVTNANKGITCDTNLVAAEEEKDVLDVVNQLTVIVSEN